MTKPKSKAVTAEEAERRLRERLKGQRRFLEEERGQGKPKLSAVEPEAASLNPEDLEPYGDGVPE